MKFVLYLLEHPVCHLLFFLVSLSSFFSLSHTLFLYLSFLSFCMYVCVRCKFNHFPLLLILSFSRCFLRGSFISPFDPSVPLDRTQGYFPSLFLSLHYTPLHGVTLFLPKPFSTFSFTLFLFSSLYLVVPYCCLPLAASSLLDLSSFPVRSIAQYTLYSFPFLVTVYSVFLVLLPYLHFSLLLTLFLPRSPTLCLFLSFFFLILCRSILVSFTSSLFIYIPFSFPLQIPLFLFFL